MKCFETGPLAYELLFKDFSSFSSGGHFVPTRGTILAILEKGHKRNISVTLF